jgi:hypothetical protein
MFAVITALITRQGTPVAPGPVRRDEDRFLSSVKFE